MSALNSDHPAWERLAALPRADLTHSPTALERLDNLGGALGLGDLYVKRDDCTGLAFGGNKTRQLEYYFGEAVQQRADHILITGAVQSNYMRMAVAAARKYGMKPVVQFEERVKETDGLYNRSGNVLLDRMMGAEILHYPDGEDETGADRALGQKADELKQMGHRPYIIPLGPGHPPKGALGYIHAAREFLEQIRRLETPVRDIVVTSGSGITHAGLLYGLRLCGSDIRVTGICARRDAGLQAERIPTHLYGINRILDVDLAVGPGDIHLHDSSLAPGYGCLNPATEEALSLTARHEGLLLDPVYTGKAMAGLMDLCRAGYFEEPVVFWHTGGQPGLFAYGDRLV